MHNFITIPGLDGYLPWDAAQGHHQAALTRFEDGYFYLMALRWENLHHLQIAGFPDRADVR